MVNNLWVTDVPPRNGEIIENTEKYENKNVFFLNLTTKWIIKYINYNFPGKSVLNLLIDSINVTNTVAAET